MSMTSMAGRWLPALVVTVGAFIGGCASAPRTTVILLPDEDVHVGAVVVGDSAGQRRLDQAFAAVTIADTQAKPSSVATRGEPAVSKAYSELLKAQPSKPVSFTLYFVLNSVALTDESKALVPEVIETARHRKPTEIAVYGHADASGTERRNDVLSAERARVVAKLLHDSDPELDHIECQSFGDRVPLVVGDGRSPQPRNRRAEVVIL